jgi:hypothetical protein
LVIDSCATRKQAISRSAAAAVEVQGRLLGALFQLHRDARQRRLGFQIGAQRRDQADLVEQRRPQVDGHLAHARDQIVDQRDRLAAPSAGAAAARAPSCSAASARSASAQLVVQLVGEEAPLVLLRGLEPAVQQPEPLVGTRSFASARSRRASSPRRAG